MKKSAIRFICIVFTMFLLLSQGVTAATQNYPGEFEFTLTNEDGKSVYPEASVGYVVMPKLKFAVTDNYIFGYNITGAIDNSIKPGYDELIEVTVEESASGYGNYSKETGEFNGTFECELTFYLANDVFSKKNYTQKLTGSFDGKFLNDGSLKITIYDATVVYFGDVRKTEPLSWVVITRSPVFLVDSKAAFNSLTGHVEIGRDRDNTLPCTLKTVIRVGDYIVTGKNSRCTIQFSDMSTFVLKENAVIIIKSPPAKETKLELVLGRIWGNVKRGFTGDGQLNIEMGQAVAGIKGTTYVCEENNGVSTLKVLDGVVEFTANADNSVATVKKGEQVSADANGLSPVISFNLAEEEAAWAEFTAPIREQDSSVNQDSQDNQDNKNPRPQQDAGRGGFYILVLLWFLAFIGWVIAVIVVLIKRNKPKF